MQMVAKSNNRLYPPQKQSQRLIINNIKLSDKEFVNLCKKDKHKKITSTVKDNGNFDITIEETEKLR